MPMMTSRNSKRRSPVNILLLMSGSIACAKATGLVSHWAKQGDSVRVACTRSVANFVGAATLEGFSGQSVLDDAFASGRVMDHIHLARWADLIVGAPATSNLINKIACGIADDVVTSLWQAAYGQDKPMFVVPAMNTHMWNYPATRASVEKLQSWGIAVLPTAEGDLACGEFGSGRMLEPDQILEHIDRVIAKTTPQQPKRILITAGGTREAIDSVRFIGNQSTGRTAAALCDALQRQGHDVHWLGAESAIRPGNGAQQSTFSSFDDLAEGLKTRLSGNSYDLVIHAAAVSDFSVDRMERTDGSPLERGGKLSSGEGMNLVLKPNPKLLDQLSAWSKNPALRIIGFKLTDGASQTQRTAAVARLFNGGGVHAVVHNDLQEMDNGQHPYRLHSNPETFVFCEDAQDLAKHVGMMLEKNP